jgi:hypothetical protein
MWSSTRGKQELLNAVWADTVVEENNLALAISGSTVFWPMSARAARNQRQ